MTIAKASARKSLGEYKPLIVYPNGKTEVCEQSPERSDRNTKQGIVPGNRMARGKTYATKEEATAVAQAWIDARRDDAIASYNKHKTERLVPEIELWGGFKD